jgi:hypothetical protein
MGVMNPHSPDLADLISKLVDPAGQLSCLWMCEAGFSG